MTLDEAVQLWHAHGWSLQSRSDYVAVMTYDEGGGLARQLDRDKGGGALRASLTYIGGGNIESRMLNKATTNLLGWIRYGRAKRVLESAQATQSR